MTHNTRRILVSAAFGVVLGCATFAHAADSSPVLAIANGKTYTEADVRAAKAAELKALAVKYESKRYALLTEIAGRWMQLVVVTAEAAAKGVTVPELATAEIKPAPVTDAEVAKFVEDNKARTDALLAEGKSQEQVLTMARNTVAKKHADQAQDEFIASLNAIFPKYKAAIVLEPPRLAVAATGPSLGPHDAPVTLVEFADFEDPYCGQLVPTVIALRAKYGDRIRIVFRQFPLDSHAFADKAAQASLCAEAQGKFWAMHDAMFKNQSTLAVNELKKTAAALGMDAAKFDTCIDSGLSAAAVASDRAAAREAGVAEAPVMFINGRALHGALPLGDIAAIVDDELRRAGQSAPAAAPAGTAAVLAVAAGQTLTEADVRAEKAEGQKLKGLEVIYQQQLHSLLETGLERLVTFDLVDAEAAARGVTHAEIVAGVKAAPVTDAEVDQFYEDNKAQIQKAKADVLPQIRHYLEQQGPRKADDDFIAWLKAKYKFETKLQPLRIDVAATGPADGPENAPVTLVEFSDFQCPYCVIVSPTLKKLKVKYGDKLRIVYRQFPLDIHPWAPKAAEASLCAADQGQFWPLHDAMFTNQKALGVADLKKLAATLELDVEKFNACLDSGKNAGQVENDRLDGVAAGVEGTPGVFINGRFLDGALPIGEFAKIVDDELRRLGK